jgi:GDPmannose 4,6-dehydratase
MTQLYDCIVKKAFITGITGQDGSYLAELLLSKDYEVHGVIRRASTFNTVRINHIYQEPHTEDRKLFLHYGDLSDSSRLTTLISTIQPDEIYNLGAQSHVAVSFDEPEYTGEVGALAVTRLLEAIKVSGLKTKFYQASSSEIFGNAASPQNELTQLDPRSPYAIAKAYGYWMTKNYREAHGIFATNGILFNHESPRRGETFVTRKITMAAARISKGLQNDLYLGNLDAIRDWGYAPDYVLGMWELLQLNEASDFVLATGEGISVEMFCNSAFSALGLDYKKYVKIDSRYKRPTEVNKLIGDATKAKSKINFQITKKNESLAEYMAVEDYKLLSQGNEIE